MPRLAFYCYMYGDGVGERLPKSYLLHMLTNLQDLQESLPGCRIHLAPPPQWILPPPFQGLWRTCMLIQSGAERPAEGSRLLALHSSNSSLIIEIRLPTSKRVWIISFNVLCIWVFIPCCIWSLSNTESQTLRVRGNKEKRGKKYILKKNVQCFYIK